jgi:hypothetical protein
VTSKPTAPFHHIHIRPRRRDLGELFCRAERVDGVRPRVVGAREFGDSYEYGGGVKWHFLPTERLWINTELFRVNERLIAGPSLHIPQV